MNIKKEVVMNYKYEHPKHTDVLRRSAWNRWHAMILRCVDKSHKCYKSYGGKGVTVCDEWKQFINYYNWFLDNYYEVEGGVEVDKDLLSGMLYSPETCVVIPSKLNQAFPKKKREEKHTSGVVNTYGKYEVKIRLTGENSKNHYLGRYDTLEEALSIYTDFKNRVIQSNVDKYEGLIPDKVFKLLKEYVF
jgi:hypothetical protein